jgi:hypothetical protein
MIKRTTDPFGLAFYTPKVGVNVLKHYQAWLKSQNIKKFHHCCFETTFHQNLELIDHFIMFTEEASYPDHLSEKVTWLENQFVEKNLKHIAHWIKNYQSTIKSLSEDEKMAATVLLALYKQDTHVLLDLRALKGCDFLLSSVKEALKWHSQNKHITLVLSRPEKWQDLAEHQIQTSLKAA